MKIFDVCACQGAQYSPYYRSGEVDFLRCAKCGIVRRHPMPSSDELEQLYTAHYRVENIIQGVSNQASGERVSNGYAQFILQHINLRKDCKVLDYGAGAGHLVHAFQTAGLDAVGVEPSQNARQFSKDHLQTELLGNLEAYDGHNFDLITMIEVIEHLTEPIPVLDALRKKLRPGGELFITTPNLNGIRSRLEGGHWREATKKFHLILFTRASLAKMLKDAGFKHVTHIRYSPIQRSSPVLKAAARFQQALDLAGTLCVVAKRD